MWLLTMILLGYLVVEVIKNESVRKRERLNITIFLFWVETEHLDSKLDLITVCFSSLITFFKTEEKNSF